MLAFPQRLRFSRDARRVFPIPARHARIIRSQPGRSNHSLERQITQRVGLDELSYLFDAHLRRNQLRFVWRVDTVVARTNRRRTTDAHVDLLRARLANHAHDLLRRRAANDRIVDQPHTFSLDQIANRIQFYTHSKRPNRLSRLDERASNEVIAHESKTKTQPTFSRISDRCGDT